jgi:hypothetical protein
MNTPDSHDGGYANGGEDAVMTIEEAMDLNSDSEMGDEADDDERGQDDVDDEDSRQSTDTYPQESPVLTDNPAPGIQEMSFLTSDPRRRRHSEEQDLSNGWEPHMDRANGLMVGNSAIGWTAES